MIKLLNIQTDHTTKLIKGTKVIKKVTLFKVLWSIIMLITYNLFTVQRKDLLGSVSRKSESSVIGQRLNCNDIEKMGEENNMLFTLRKKHFFSFPKNKSKSP